MAACTQIFIVAAILLTASAFLILKWMPTRSKQQLQAWCGRRLPMIAALFSTKDSGCGACSSGGCGTCTESKVTAKNESDSKELTVIKRV